MSLKFGNVNIDSMYFGDKKIAEGWVGNVKVFGTSPAPSSTVKIGGRDYPFVQIGDQLWITENLDWKFDGLTFRDGVDGNNFDTTAIPQAAYYEYDESTYGVTGNKYGLIYNWYAIAELELPTGWHVPSRSEVEALIAYIGESDAGTKLKAASPTWNGTDDYDFHAVPTGFIAGSTFYSVGSESKIWTSTDNGGGDSIGYVLQTYMNGMSVLSLNQKSGSAIRLCCSAT